MTVESRFIELRSSANGEVHDISVMVQEVVSRSELQNGTVTIFSPSSTSAITTIEYESGCVADIQRLFDEIISQDREYAHNARWGDGNGHSHVRSALLGPSMVIPFIENRLTLGTWQQIIFVDFDNKPRQRSLVLQLIGE